MDTITCKYLFTIANTREWKLMKCRISFLATTMGARVIKIEWTSKKGSIKRWGCAWELLRKRNSNLDIYIYYHIIIWSYTRRLIWFACRHNIVARRLVNSDWVLATQKINVYVHEVTIKAPRSMNQWISYKKVLNSKNSQRKTSKACGIH